MEKGGTNMPALYIHLPFCTKKCAYCDFASYPGREADFGRYIERVGEEMRAAKETWGKMPVETIFIGGGTPSLLPGEAVMRLLAMARARFDVDPEAEITCEANPGTVDPEKLRDYRDAGVNRLSFGAQAAQDGLLAQLGRIHTWQDVVQALEWSRQAGFRNLSVDLMYGLPGQDMRQWVETVEKALKLPVVHMSLYSLIVEPGTPLAKRIGEGEIAVPPDELSLKMRSAAERILARRGFARYEISNYCMPGWECRHNITYWTRGEYLGVGCAAHSLMCGERFENPRDLDAYLAGAGYQNRQKIPIREAMEEAIMLETRMSKGMDLQCFHQKYGVDLLNSCKTAVNRLESLQMVRISDGHLHLTDRGMDVQNAIVIQLVSALSNIVKQCDTIQ